MSFSDDLQSVRKIYFEGGIGRESDFNLLEKYVPLDELKTYIKFNIFPYIRDERHKEKLLYDLNKFEYSEVIYCLYYNYLRKFWIDYNIFEKYRWTFNIDKQEILEILMSKINIQINTRYDKILISLKEINIYPVDVCKIIADYDK